MYKGLKLKSRFNWIAISFIAVMFLFGSLSTTVYANDLEAASQAETSNDTTTTIINSSIEEVAITGSGTQEDPYIITNKYQLSPNSINTIYSDLSAHYKLGNDIIFTKEDFAQGAYFYDYGTNPSSGISGVYGLGFEPIGNWPDPFTGVFDGAGYSITGLYSEYDGTFRNIIGLFGNIEGATIKNLNLVNVNIITESNVEMFTGGITGFAENSQIIDCSVSGNITGDSIVGGIAGEITGTSSITGCTNGGTIVGSASPFLGTGNIYSEVMLRVGGIVGSNIGGLIDNCVNNETISAYGAGALHNSVGAGGGIAGYVASGIVQNSINNGEVTTTTLSMSSYPLYVALASGGIVGEGDVPTIINCKNTAYIISYSSSSASVSSANSGGIIGKDSASDYGTGGTITDCSNSGKIHVDTDQHVLARGGGIAGSSDSSIQSCSNTGEILVSATSRERAVYGFAGGIVGDGFSLINSCYNTGNIYNWGYALDLKPLPAEDELFEMHLRTGGIAGSAHNATVTNCYNTGNLTVGNYQPDTVEQNESYVYTGGIIGMLISGNTFNCYNTGTLDSENPSGRIGGGVGAVSLDTGIPTIESLYTNTNNNIVSYIISNTDGISYNDYPARLSNEQMQNKASFLGFSFGDIWIFDSATSYPYPELVSFTDYDPIPENTVITGPLALGTKRPVKGDTPSSTSDISIPVGSKYNVTDLTWNGNPTVFYGSTVYVSDVTLTALNGYTFDDNVSFLINGTTDITTKSISADKTELVITITYNQLTQAVLERIEVAGDFKSFYYSDEKFDSTGMIIEATYDDTSTGYLNSGEYAFSQTTFDVPENISEYGYIHTIKVQAHIAPYPYELLSVRVTKRSLTPDDFTFIAPEILIANFQPKEAKIEIANKNILAEHTSFTIIYSEIENPNFMFEPPITTPPTEEGTYYVFAVVRQADESYYFSSSYDNPLYMGQFTIQGNTADVNRDSVVDYRDLAEVLSTKNYNKLTSAQGVNINADVNTDGVVNFIDATLVRNSTVYGKTY